MERDTSNAQRSKGSFWLDVASAGVCVRNTGNHKKLNRTPRQLHPPTDSEEESEESNRLVRLLAGELEMCGVFVVRNLRHWDLAPQVWGEEGVCFGDLSGSAEMSTEGE